MIRTCFRQSSTFLATATAFALLLSGEAILAQRPRPAAQPRPAPQPIPDSRSALRGVVADPTHAAMPGVTIALEDLARRVTHRATTDREGRFQIGDLPAGDYEAEVVVPGFEVVRQRVLLAGPLVEQAIVLSVAPVEETFTVAAGAQGATSDAFPGRARGDAEPCVPRIDQETQSPIGGQVRAPRMLTRTPPVFPDHLRQAEIDGLVRLSGRIGTEGSLIDVSVVEASHPDYAAAAEDAVRGWTWEEALLNCTPVEAGVTISVRFVPQR